jgi:hypothetical protein
MGERERETERERERLFWRGELFRNGVIVAKIWTQSKIFKNSFEKLF